MQDSSVLDLGMVFPYLFIYLMVSLQIDLILSLTMFTDFSVSYFSIYLKVKLMVSSLISCSSCFMLTYRFLFGSMSSSKKFMHCSVSMLWNFSKGVSSVINRVDPR